MGCFRLRNGPNRNAEWAVSDCETGRFAKPVGMDEKIERIDKPVWLGYTLYAFVPVCIRCRAAALLPCAWWWLRSNVKGSAASSVVRTL